MEIQKIKIKSDYKLSDLIHEIEKGILRIPRFQRKFVWEKSKVIKLLDSIYKEYPIGSFFFWTAPRKYYFFYRDIAELNLPKPDRYEKISFIIDGQQRITSLYATIKGLKLYGRDYSKICFDLDKKEFVDKKPDRERFISVSELLDDDNLDIYDKLTSERKKSFRWCVHKFNNYPFSAINVRDKELDEVCDIFERINQGGRRLNLFDLISAGTWSTNFDLREKVDEVNKKLEEGGFGKIDNEIFTQTLALISRGPCTRSSQLQLREQDISSYWENTTESIKLAIDYLRNNLGVVNYNFIPYRGMISLTAYLFYKIKKRSFSNKQSQLLHLWFWKSAFSERYGASTLTYMSEDKKLFDKIAEKKDVNIRFPIALDIDSLIKLRMYRKSAVKNGVLCLLASKNPRHFKNNSLLPLRDSYYSDFNNAEKHHIFPKSMVREKFGLAIIHSLPNFCFLPAELNKEISNKKPSKYFEEFEKGNQDFKNTLKTHLIKYDNSIKKNNFKSFLGSRSAIILEEITRITGSKISRVISSSANRAVDKIEKSIRDLIARELKLEQLKDWKEKIPSNVFGEIKKRAKAYLKKDPSKEFSDFTSRELLDFCDVMDYPNIIFANWNIFYPYFRSKSELEKRFISFKEYRNAIKHNREIASFIKKDGEVSLEWFSAALKGALKSSKTEESTKKTNWIMSKNLFDLFSQKVLDLDSRIKIRPVKYYVGFNIDNKNIIEVKIRASKLLLQLLRVRPKDLVDPEKKTRYVKNSFKDYRKHITQFDIKNEDDIDYAILLVKQICKKFNDDEKRNRKSDK